MVTVTLHQDRIIRIKLKIVSLNLNLGLCVLFTVFPDKTITQILNIPFLYLSLNLSNDIQCKMCIDNQENL